MYEEVSRAQTGNCNVTERAAILTVMLKGCVKLVTCYPSLLYGRTRRKHEKADCGQRWLRNATLHMKKSWNLRIWDWQYLINKE